MKENIDQLPENIKQHLHNITKSSGLPDNEASFNLIANNWIEKNEMFEGQIRSLDMVEINSFKKDDLRPAILLSYSGSLVSLGPDSNGKRWIEYASIKLRQNVPNLLVGNNAELNNDIFVDYSAEFDKGPIKATSALYKIAVCKEDLDLKDQEDRIKEATIFLTNGFIKINRDTLSFDKNLPDQFSTKPVVDYLALKYDMTKKLTKDILHDYLQILESGMLLGERVSLGKIGRLFIKLKPPQKARLGRNIKTGEEIMIKAQPEKYVPKISFGKRIKEKTASKEVK